MVDKLTEIAEVLSNLKEDVTVPKNIRVRISGIIDIINENAETCLKVHKALNVLDEISDDNNIQPYTRTQIWNIVSMLESI